ncbi:hypothetical protein DMH20_16450 [Escherichia coli]|nr:hypothetical protein [Escherichia coli]
MGKREDTKHTPVRGLYMWGGVGRGKTADGPFLSKPAGRAETASALSPFYAAGT